MSSVRGSVYPAEHVGCDLASVAMTTACVSRLRLGSTTPGFEPLAWPRWPRSSSAASLKTITAVPLHLIEGPHDTVSRVLG